jgi:hypothetical protein
VTLSDDTLRAFEDYLLNADSQNLLPSEGSVGSNNDLRYLEWLHFLKNEGVKPLNSNDRSLSKQAKAAAEDKAK